MKTSTGLTFSKTKSFGNSGNIGVPQDKFNYTSSSGNTHLGNKNTIKSSSKFMLIIYNKLKNRFSRLSYRKIMLKKIILLIFRSKFTIWNLK